MILRKPYALLIKYFRIIHIILSVLMGYIVFKTGDLLYFLNSYIQRGYYDKLDSLIKQYTHFSIFIVISLIIIGTIIIFLLMQFKKKPRLFYFITIVVYIAALFLFTRAYFNLKVMETTVIDPRAIRLTRDLVLIFSFVQYVVIANTIFTATGFNIKKFNFQEDLEELNIGSADNEEFEFVLGFNFEAFKVKLRKLKRNIRYIFLENFFVMLTLVILIAFLIFGYIILDTQVINKIYSENQAFTTSKYKVNITESYITDKDYKGNVISKGYDYVIVKLDLTNITSAVKIMDSSNIMLIIKNRKYYPVVVSSTYFNDIGTIYNQQPLLVNTQKSYILVYKIEKDYENQQMRLKVLSKFVGNKMKYIRVSLTPRNMSQTTLVNTKSLKEQLNFSDSILKNTKLTINDYELKSQYIYKYKLCLLNECNDMSDYVKANTLTIYDKTVLRLDLQFSLDKDFNGPTPKNAYELIETFGKIRYYMNGQVINHDVAISNLTPKYYVGSSIYIDVLKELETANRIEIIFNIRDKKYIYVVKSK